ncbi:MAG: DUF1244 domain-containing protein [Halieaceae bacterium]|nr:DUF1244 domain-containing protein [Halieaceae bacterium]
MTDSISPEQATRIEAAVFRRLLEHLDSRSDVQNIDLMNLAGFCRNCLSKWYLAAAEEEGLAVDYDAARERVYGMPYGEWKQRYQGEASAAQLAAFERNKPR